MGWTERFSIAGNRAVITGASKGIGYELCRVFAEAGADVAAVARDEAGLAEVRREVESFGRRCVTIRADLARVDDTRRAAQEALAGFGTVDILVNNAGIALNAPLDRATVEDWDMTMAVNLRAPFLMAQALAPGMIAQRRGKIVNVSSQSGVNALEDHGAYCASKGGLNMLTKVMMLEWAKFNIQVNAVCPTVILTPMGEKAWGPPEKGGPMLAKIPGGRFGKPVEVADACLFLASPASDMINGDCLMIEGGFTSV